MQFSKVNGTDFVSLGMKYGASTIKVRLVDASLHNELYSRSKAHYMRVKMFTDALAVPLLLNNKLSYKDEISYVLEMSEYRTHPARAAQSCVIKPRRFPIGDPDAVSAAQACECVFDVGDPGLLPRRGDGDTWL